MEDPSSQPSPPQPRSRIDKEPAAGSGNGGQDRGCARPEDSDSDDSSLGVGGDCDDDAPLEAGEVAPEGEDDDDDDDDAPLEAGEVTSEGEYDEDDVPLLTSAFAGPSRKRGQPNTSPAALVKKPCPTSFGGDKDAVVTAAAAAAGNTRVPDPSLQGTGPAAESLVGSKTSGGSVPVAGEEAAGGAAHQAVSETRQGVLCAVAGDVLAAPTPTEVRVIDLTGKAAADAPEEGASSRALWQPTPEIAGDATTTAGDATQAAPSATGDMGQPLPAKASNSAPEKPLSPQPAPLSEQGAAGLSQAGGTSPHPNAPSGS
ncbi:uncharacterized protein LOC104581377 [Brachypodium distachyon]|uniref:uncharacterized protein LOC104581377 n=1 Tax=Brachypodium distachyon TaxID=15368 RepID=UPI00052FEE13|nr:uncharacterized protein LOC104581377 [Brachypodium distachyon]|eukprot:XP_010227157.1 uncharacterized protein LOC104581377 [Brachypodium distachyon]